MSRLRTLIHEPQSDHTRPVAIHARRAEWTAWAMIVVGLGFLLIGLVLTLPGCRWAQRVEPIGEGSTGRLDF